jgi:putative membrane protein insertion efficiency factor
MTWLLQTLLLTLLRGYKAAVSPFLPPACRYVPTCSEYAAEAVELHGPFRGSAMAIWRVMRCHPFVRGGYDPVPWNPLPRNGVVHQGEEGADGAALQPTAGGGCPGH